MHIRKAVKDLKPYKPGRPLRDLEAYGLSSGVKLGSNENPLGPAPGVVEAIAKACAEVRLYPEPGAPLLREALAKRYQRPLDTIITGAGIDDLLDLTLRSMLEPGDNIVMAKPGFVRYAVATQNAGGECREISGTAQEPYRHNLAAMLEAIDERTRAVVVVNPNNPTGAMVTRSEWESFWKQVPTSVLTILDEAYYEFVEDDQYPDGLNYLDDGRPLLVFRTFSKCHSLAGLRVGYGMGPASLIDYLDRARLPFSVNHVAACAAVAALESSDHVARTRALTHQEVPFLAKALSERGWEVHPSWANFVFARTPLPGTPLAQALLRRGFILRPLTGFGLTDDYFRVSHGTREQNEQFLRALDAVSAELPVS